MIIDIDRLRRDLLQDCYAAYFGGGIGPAIIEAAQAECAEPQELITMALERGMDLRRYEC